MTATRPTQPIRRVEVALTVLDEGGELRGYLLATVSDVDDRGAWTNAVMNALAFVHGDDVRELLARYPDDAAPDDEEDAR